ncbi:MAG: Rieske 2Fe-2S domain-containing protein [Chloroflexota bacterium]|nr:Rieske 2Fe-2S domain-containing protein [Chloroflexota bacterium]
MPLAAQTARSDRAIPAIAILPLRLFLGITFLYAAIQKINDPGFLRAGSPTYIGAQMLAFSRGSPIKALLHHLMAYAGAVGLLTVLTEGSIGLLILLGLFTRPAALVGLALSFGFFLSASWQTYPYFFGSDIVFVVCWLTLAITGPGVYALDTRVAAPLHRAVSARQTSPLQRLLFTLLTGWHHPTSRLDPSADDEQTRSLDLSGADPRRRQFTRGEALVGSVVTLGLIVLGLHPRVTATSQSSVSNALPKAQPTGVPPTPAAGAAAAPTAAPTAAAPAGSNPAIPAGAKKIGNISQVPVNTAGTVTDPKTGDPAIIVHTSGSTFVAYDAVCTHAGCTVQYDPQQRLLVCPCHGGTFDPAHGAQVVAGPPPSPLAPIDMKIDSAGDIYIV